MSSTPEIYLFPDAAAFQSQTAAPPGEPSPEQSAAKEALARGYADGFAQGRSAAEQALKFTLAAAEQEGFARGREEGLQQVVQAAEALRQALAEIERGRTQLMAEAESFCVELALAMVGRLVEANQVRSDFVRRTIRSALVSLMPDGSPRIFLHPADLKLATAFPDLPLQPDESLAPGAARVEAGRFVIESSLEQAFEQVRAAVLETRTRRGADQS